MRLYREFLIYGLDGTVYTSHCKLFSRLQLEVRHERPFETGLPSSGEHI